MNPDQDHVIAIAAGIRHRAVAQMPSESRNISPKTRSLDGQSSLVILEVFLAVRWSDAESTRILVAIYAALSIQDGCGAKRADAYATEYPCQCEWGRM